jgi:hypothetical protein
MAMWPTHKRKASDQQAKRNWLKKQRKLARRVSTKNVQPEVVNDALV